MDLLPWDKRAFQPIGEDTGGRSVGTRGSQTSSLTIGETNKRAAKLVRLICR